MHKNQKKLLIAANWKMTPATVLEAKKKAHSFKNISKKYDKMRGSSVRIEVLVCPPYPYISDLLNIFKKSSAQVGAQDISLYDGGSKTAEVGSTMIQSLGAEYTIVGHSERRAAGDTDEMVAVKLGQVLRTKMNAILCIGESERDNEAHYLEEIKRQMKASLARMSNSDFSRLVIAYEPVWAIGRTDNVALSGHELHQMVIYIRKVLKDLYNETVASQVKILYGGSVTPENTSDIIWNGEVDGLLIGRASFEAKSYDDICKAIITPILQADTFAKRQSIKKSIKNIKNNRASIQRKEKAITAAALRKAKRANKVAKSGSSAKNGGKKAGKKTKSKSKATKKINRKKRA